MRNHILALAATVLFFTASPALATDMDGALFELTSPTTTTTTTQTAPSQPAEPTPMLSCMDPMGNPMVLEPGQICDMDGALYVVSVDSQIDMDDALFALDPTYQQTQTVALAPIYQPYVPIQ